MANNPSIDSRTVDAQGWPALNMLAYPWCLLVVQIFTRRVMYRPTLEYTIQSMDPPPAPPSFEVPNLQDQKVFTPEKRAMLDLEGQSLRYQAEISRYQAQQVVVAIPQNGLEGYLDWSPLSFEGFNNPDEDSPQKVLQRLGKVPILCRPQQAISLFASTAPDLVLLQKLEFVSSGPTGPWWRTGIWDLVPLHSPFLRPLVLVPQTDPPKFPLPWKGSKATLLNKAYAQNGLWGLAEVHSRPYDPVADGM